MKKKSLFSFQTDNHRITEVFFFSFFFFRCFSRERCDPWSLCLFHMNTPFSVLVENIQNYEWLCVSTFVSPRNWPKIQQRLIHSYLPQITAESTLHVFVRTVYLAVHSKLVQIYVHVHVDDLGIKSSKTDTPPPLKFKTK